MKRLYKPKRKCCRNDPRCKRCPVVARKLVRAGRAERRADGLVAILPNTKKKHLKAARKR